MVASVGMRKTVPSLKVKENEAIRKSNLKDRGGTNILPLRENEIAANFLCYYIYKNVVYITKGGYQFSKS